MLDLISRASLLLLATTLFGCGTASPDDGASEETADDLVVMPAIAGFWQIDHAHPTAGEITLLSLSTNGTFWAERCVDDTCDPAQGLSGTYRRAKTAIRFYDGTHVPIGSWSYKLSSGALTLRRTGTSDRYTLYPMSETACDDSGGAWSDDDFATHGFNCTCPDDSDWGPSGCASFTPPSSSCAAGQTLCDRACVDLSSDPTNCGACRSMCTKAQSCIAGSCH